MKRASHHASGPARAASARAAARFAWVAATALAAAALSGPPAAAYWPMNGTPLCARDSLQIILDIAGDGAGGAFVCWRDFRGGQNADIYASRVTADGAVATGWPADGLPICTAAGNVWDPSIAEDGSGGAYIAWDDERVSWNQSAPYLQRVAADASIPMGWPVDGKPLCTATYDGGGTRVAYAGSGSAIVVWDDGRTGSRDVYAQRVLASGAIAPGWPATGLAVCTAPGEQYNIRLVPNGSSGAFIVWEDHRSGYPGDIYVQQVTSVGTIVGGWPANGLGVATGSRNQSAPQAASDGGGGVLISWAEYGVNTDNRVQRITATGAVAAGWPAAGVLVEQYYGTGSHDVVGDGSGGALVVYEHATAASFDLYGQHVASDGSIAPGWPAGGLGLSAGAGIGTRPVAVADGTGHAIVGWEDQRNSGQLQNVYAQRAVLSNLDATVTPWGFAAPVVPRNAGDAQWWDAYLTPTLDGNATNTWVN